MEHRRKIIKFSLLSIGGLILAFVLTNPINFGLCPLENKYCFDPYDEIVGQPLAFFSLITFVLSIIFLFVDESIFNAWKRFAKYYLLVAAVLIGITPSVDASVIGIDREIATWFLALVFLFWSVGIIISKFIALRRIAAQKFR